MTRGHRADSTSSGGDIPFLAERDLDELLRGGANLILALDGVQDPHNLGACLRSADGAGVQAVVVPRHRAAGLSDTVRRVACGGAERVPLIQVVNMGRALEDMRAAGLKVVGTADDARATLYEADLRAPLVLVLGAEGVGLRRGTRDKCDELLRIPMAGAVECLNVSVSAGVCLYEAVRQRRAAAP